ncbi:MAG: 30S ribosomal protein S2 [Planctomycetota bacterium]
MASLVNDLIEAGIHFGHRSTHWNPKMAPYIFGKRNRIHIIDVKQTIKGLLLARKFVTKTVAEGKDVLFVGTKRQARNIIEKHVKECGMHYCTERWLGGTLTNFSTIRQRLKRLEELERLEESGEMENYSKKMEATLNREKTKILRNLEGIRNMTKLPGLMVIIDVNAETNAVKEARKLGIPTVCLIDTDSDPDFADIPIPGNDDAMRAIEVVIDQLCRAVNEGKQSRSVGKDDGGDGSAPDAGSSPLGPGPRGKRSSRAQFSADAPTPAGEGTPAQDDAPAGDAGGTPEAAAPQPATTN